MNKILIKTLILISFYQITPANAREVQLAGNLMSGNMQVKSWKAIKDEKVIKQDFDYSCGASSLSTIFTYFYNKKISEKEILDNMQLDDMMASFADLSRVSQKFGYQAKGIFTNYDTLKKIKIPAIVYLQPNRSDHFSVVRAINDTHVYLADSSWGNRKLSRAQFEKVWHTTKDKKYSGKVLLIIPTTQKQKDAVNSNYITIQKQNSLLNKLPIIINELPN